jgi:hypothetical protein
MYRFVIVINIMIFVVSATSTSRAENEFTLEAAIGLALQEKSFAPDWPGYVGDDGLICREFAARIQYRYNSLLTLSSTFGFFNDWKKPRDILYFDRPDLWYPLMAKRKFIYLRPTMRLAAEWLRLDLGLLLLIENADSLRNKTEFYIFDGEKSVFPVLGIELGEDNGFLYAGLANSFPMVSGGGIIEMGLGGRYKGIYEHKFFTAASGYQDISLGYRGEFRVYKNIAITPGFSIGGRDRENVYMITLGIKSLMDL